MTFRNRGMRIEMEPGAGRLLDAKIENLAVWIDDLERWSPRPRGGSMDPAPVCGAGSGESPVGQELGDDLPDLRIAGRNTVEFELAVPADSRPSHARADRFVGQ